MGRYYTGDINGKFWFGLQSSEAASRFGGEEYEPNYISYHFDEEHLKDVEEEIENIKEKLGDKLKVIEDFFKDRAGYNDEMLAEAGIGRKELEDYADLGLGIQIRDCIIEKKECNFDAEL
jgi:hypothetical protein